MNWTHYSVVAVTASYAVCFVWAMVHFVRFYRTRNRRHLWFGLPLMLGLPGLVLLALFIMGEAAWFGKDETPKIPSASCYRPGMEQPVSKENAEFVEEHARLEKKFRDRMAAEAGKKPAQDKAAPDAAGKP